MEKHSEDLALGDRYKKAKKVVGIRSHHCFLPRSENSLDIHRVSSDAHGYIATVFDVETVEKETSTEPENAVVAQSTMSTYQPGQYIAAVYDGDLYIGLITERSDECEDVKVRFTNHSKCSGMLTWPRLDDVCWIPFQHILCIIPVTEAYAMVEVLVCIN